MSKLYDKVECCVSFIIKCFNASLFGGQRRAPLFVGLNGAQGSGKTTLVSYIELCGWPGR